MPLEIARITVAPDNTERFQAAVATALAEVFPRASGYVRGEARRGIESRDTFLLMLEWERVEDHTVGFVESALFTRWLELTDGLIDGDPEVLHWEPIG